MNEQPTAWHDFGPMSQLATLVGAALEDAARALAGLGDPTLTGTARTGAQGWGEPDVGVGHASSEVKRPDGRGTADAIPAV